MLEDTYQLITSVGSSFSELGISSLKAAICIGRYIYGCLVSNEIGEFVDNL